MCACSASLAGGIQAWEREIIHCGMIREVKSAQIESFDRKRALVATAAVIVAVALLAAGSMLFLDHQDFVDWGFLIGPLAWVLACVAAARVAALSLLAGLAGAAIAGIPSALATLTGLHWLGIVVGVLAFAGWSGSARAARL